MLKTIENLANGKLLTAHEQQEILGGLRCVDGDCDIPGYCCSHGYCVIMNPGPGKLQPACE